MTESEIRSKIALNAGQAEGLVRGTSNIMNSSTNLDMMLVKKIKSWLNEAVSLFEENEKLQKELIVAIERG